MHDLKKKIGLVTKFGFVFVFCLVVGAAVSPKASAQLFKGAKEEACSGIRLDGSLDAKGAASNSCVKEGDGRVNGVLQLAINLFSLVVGVIAVIMIIIGGLKLVTAQGDSNSVASGRNTILYAVIGLVVVAVAQILVRFVLSKVGNI